MSEASGLPLINERAELKDKKEYEMEMKRIYSELKGVRKEKVS